MRTGVISRMCALSCYGPAAATQRHRMLEKRMCAPGLIRRKNGANTDALEQMGPSSGSI